MNRLVSSAIVVGLLGATSPAHAADHLMRISEVLLSQDGSTANQYIELVDPGEPFPASPYELVIYDANAAMIDTVSLPVPASTTRYYVSTAGADLEFGTDNDVELDVALPADGQVCFQNGATRIHCIAWGCVTPVTAGTQRGPTPPDGQSLQRQANGDYQLAAPTPDAANVAGVTMPACPSGTPDAGPAPDADPGAPDASPGEEPDAGGTGGGDDEGGGCCSAGSRGEATGFAVLALGVLLVLRRRATGR
jgi:hypothetical protein